MLLASVDFEEAPDVENEPQAIVGPKTAPKPPVTAKVGKVASGGLRVKNRGPQPPQSPREYPASQASPEWGR